MPEHDAVEAAELSLRLLAESLRREAAGRVVVEQLVPEPDERDREAAARPCELGRAVGAVVVRDPNGRLGAPAVSASRQAGQSAGSSGAAKIFAVSSPSRAASGSSGTAVGRSIGLGTSGSRGLLERDAHARREP